MGLPVFVQSDSLCVDGYSSLAERLAARKDIFMLPLRMEGRRKKVRAWLARTWLDVRLFGQIFAFSGAQGRCQRFCNPWGRDLCHGTSVERLVVIKDIHITKSTNGEVTKGSAKGKSSDTMGSKSIVEQGLYVVKGSVNPFYADKNGVSHEDVEVLKKALATIFENDESCARPAGSMAVCRLYWFEQPENHACVPVHNIFELLDIQNQGSGYVCCLKELPDGVRVTELI
ncbi:MAG: type I CRISPR-associated protein Cas7 [Enterocloster bolteae]